MYSNVPPSLPLQNQSDNNNNNSNSINNVQSNQRNEIGEINGDTIDSESVAGAHQKEES